MNVGLIVCSYSGNTLSVAQKLEEAIKAAGHAASVVRVEPVNEDPRSGAPAALKSAPDVGPYDAVIFASPVHALSLAPLMKLYLAQISDLTGKKAACFVTQHFKKAWLGGNHAVQQITAACKAKGADVIASGVVNWSGSARETQIADLVSRLSKFWSV